MALAVEDIARIDALLEALGTGAEPDAVAYALQCLVPGVGLRQCDASDVLEDPFRSAGACDLHLLDTSNHCIRVMDSPAEATGILLAAKVVA
ncbi:hypothetical protein [Novosphingobium mangrovi (ex Huang et al. 2023)]|uniref:Uncharacterized protein n=1 Tax=Novosphingobium mangrovi (ex Huang et al. 2023) TaxID=2976432 RepID=A0ABT2I691_9SPHN|nr:hypothetical protein [Novosphingobium mangrovi (ex Huang et al. 2023)]MCT2400327.1 hypothetical protein [Novosphingobium mangrovi (ex Huang et al. 2023)]